MDYSELYALFSDVTPLSVDCGRACDGACCAANEPEAAGMLLFPGEPATGDIRETQAGKLFVCNGSCDRKTRPLACRIFPLFPYLTADGRIRAVYDPRAFRLCPLVRQRTHVALQRDFVRAVRRAGRLLCRDEVCRAFLAAQSCEIDAINAFLRLEQGRAPICRRNGRDTERTEPI